MISANERSDVEMEERRALQEEEDKAWESGRPVRQHRRRLVLPILRVVLELSLGAALLYFLTIPPATVELINAPAPVSSGVRMCSLDEYNDGRWEMRPGGVYTSLEEMREEHGMMEGYFSPCYARDNSNDPTPAHVERILTTSSYHYTPTTRCSLHPFSRETFLIRLLRSYSGLWLVGDSLSWQHFEMLWAMLGTVGGPVVKQGFELRLDAGNPAGRVLMRLAGVGESRLERPLVRLIRHDRLLEDGALEEALADVGVTGYRQTDPRDVKGEWYPQLRKEVLEHDKEGGWEDTIVVMNTGAHWSRQATSLATVDDLMLAYSEVSRVIMKRITDLPRINFFYRATSPGHMGCEGNTVPDPTLNNFLASATEAGRNSGKEYDWDIFPLQNKVWEGIVKNEEREGRGERVHWIDGWRMANQRPDAHLRPPSDCLHTCLPSIHEQWTKMIWHVMQEGLLTQL